VGNTVSKKKAPFSKQIQHFSEKLTGALNNSLQAKILIPSDSFLLLELADFLIHKLDDRVKIRYFSESVKQVMEFANINVDFLNPKLQDKIYQAMFPFTFDKLSQNHRLHCFKDVMEYKEQLRKVLDAFDSEIVICPYTHIRFGPSAYWL